MIKINTETYNILKTAANPQLAERDYLECSILDKLFQTPYFSNKCVFAGGGSIIKSYNLCHRATQDLDLSYQDFDDIPETPTKRQLNKFKRRFKDFVFDELKPKIGDAINPDQQFMIMTDRDWHVLENKEQFMSYPTLHILYKSAFDTNMGHICIEIIARKYDAETVRFRSVVPYSTGVGIGNIPTVRYEQTFWDKIYALHSTAVTDAPRLRESFSRHYYDTANIWSRVDLPATQHMLAKIERYQMKYTTRAIASIDAMRNVRLIPDSTTLARLEADYNNNIQHGTKESWSQIVRTLQHLNRQINTL